MRGFFTLIYLLGTDDRATRRIFARDGGTSHRKAGAYDPGGNCFPRPRKISGGEIKKIRVGRFAAKRNSACGIVDGT